MLCTNCRNENAEGSKFCRFCGAPLFPVVQTAPVQEPAPVKEAAPVQEPAPVKEAATAQQTPPVQQTPPMQGNQPPQWMPPAQGAPQWNPPAQGGYMQQPVKQKKEKGKAGKIILIAVIAAVLLIGGVVGGILGARAAAYSKANQLFEEGQYEQAVEAFEKMGDYKDAPERAAEAARCAEEAAREDAYAEAERLRKAGDYAEAEKRYAAGKPYSDSAQMELFARALDCDDRGDGAAAYAIVEAEEFTDGMTAEHAAEAEAFRARIFSDYEWETNVAKVENGTADQDTCDYFYNQYCETLSQDAYNYMLQSLHIYAAATCRDYETSIKGNQNFFEGYFDSNRDFYDALLEAGYIEFAQDQCYDKLRLEGNWKGEIAYFNMDPEGYIEFNMPVFDFGDYYDIYDHILYFYSVDENGQLQERKDIYEITFETDDCITIYCYKDGSSYTLNRVG